MATGAPAAQFLLCRELASHFGLREFAGIISGAGCSGARFAISDPATSALTENDPHAA
jgi:hypothetical protein